MSYLKNDTPMNMSWVGRELADSYCPKKNKIINRLPTVFPFLTFSYMGVSKCFAFVIRVMSTIFVYVEREKIPIVVGETYIPRNK